MYKKIDHIHQDDISRFYLGGQNSKLLLEIKNINGGCNIGETVNIGGRNYLVIDITYYPEVNIVDYYLM